MTVSAILLSLVLLSACSPHAARLAASRPSAVVVGKRESRGAVDSAMGRQIINAIDAGDGDYEIRRLRQRMSAEPGNIKIRLDLALLYQARGFPEIAIEHYRLAAQRFPDSAEAHLALATHLRKGGAAGEAARVLDAFVSTHPADAAVWAWTGIIRDEAGRIEEGERAHRAAIGKNGRQAYLHNNLGHNLLLQGRREEAAAEFRRALEIEPRSPIARNNLAIVLADNRQEAVKHLQSVADPSTAHNNLAAVLIEQERYQEARQELSLALGYRPGNPAALRNAELVARLDGHPARIELDRARTAAGRWRKFGSFMSKVFLSPGEPAAGRREQAAPEKRRESARGPGANAPSEE